MQKPNVYVLHPIRAMSVNYAELQQAFYDGSFFYAYEYGSPKLTNIHDIPDGAIVRIVYAKEIDDFNFGDDSSIDREYSLSFVVVKQQAEIC